MLQMYTQEKNGDPSFSHGLLLNFQKFKPAGNHRQESGSVEPINKGRFFFCCIKGRKSLFNSSARGANYAAGKK